MASDVGAESATSVDAPKAAALATISNEQRLVMTTKPSVGRRRPSRSSAPISLSSALWRPTSSRTATIAPSALAPSGGVDRARLRIERLMRVERGDARRRSPPERSAVGAVDGVRGCGKCARSSMPQRPQPVRPAMARAAREMRAHALARQRDVDAQPFVGALDLDGADFGSASR